MRASPNTTEGLEGKIQRPDFGTYHHTTTRASEETREMVKALFRETFDRLPFSKDDRLKILDMGCGLGFLSCFCAEYYRSAMITGIDTFGHASLKGSSLARAKDNARILGFSERIRFEKGDILRADYGRAGFDLFVTSLVFHNLGKRRFDAYERLARWVTRKSYVVLGDVFFDYERDIGRLKKLFESLQERPGLTSEGVYKVLVLSKPRERPT